MKNECKILVGIPGLTDVEMEQALRMLPSSAAEAAAIQAVRLFDTDGDYSLSEA